MKVSAKLLKSFFPIMFVSFYFLGLPTYYALVSEGSHLNILFTYGLFLSIASYTIFFKKNIVLSTTSLKGVACFIGIFCLYFVSYLLLNDEMSDLALSVTIKATLYFLIFLTFFLIFSKKFIDSRKLFIYLTLLTVLFNIIDFFDNGQFFSYDLEGYGVRAAGFYINANVASEAILVGMILSYRSVSEKYRIFYMLLCLIGILVTFSRGGILTWIIVVVLSFLFGYNKLKIRLLDVISILSLVAVVSLVLSNLNNYLDESLVENRVDFISGKDNINSIKDDSRYEILNKGLDGFYQSPIFGNGSFDLMRKGDSVLPHNEYVLILDDFGILGIIIYLTLIYMVFKNTNDWILIIFILIYAFFTHNQLTSNVMLILFAVSFSSNRIRPGINKISGFNDNILRKKV